MKKFTPITACIYTQYPTESESLRKYFESFNCLVAVNRFTNYRDNYRIIFGNYHFVKTLSGRLPKAFGKTLHIIVTGENNFTLRDIKHDNKVVVTDSPVMTEEKVKKILHHFLINKNNLLKIEGKLSTGERIINKQTPKPHEALPGHNNRTVNMPRVSREPSLKFFEDTKDSRRINQMIKEIYSQENIIIKKNIHKINLKFYLKIFIVALISTTAIYLLSILYTSAGIYTGYRLFMSGHNDVGGKVIASIKYPLAYLGIVHRPLSQIFYIFGDRTFAVGIETAERLLLNGVDLYPDLLVLEKELQKASVNFRTGDNQDSPQILLSVNSLQILLPEIDKRLALIKYDLSKIKEADNYPSYLSVIKYQVAGLEDRVDGYRRLLTTGQKALSLFKTGGGFDRERQYLLLLQNSAELRPTGGFIGSYATLNVAEGRPLDFSMHDVYDLDGQLKGHVDPPEPLKRLLGSEHWYFRDSNWDPDFRKSGEKSLWFYRTVTGENPDGVIAVSSVLFNDILALIGSVYLPDYNLTITPASFAGQTRTLIESDFFPGSTQKRNFLQSFFTAIVKQIDSDGEKLAGPLIKILLSALDEGLILLYSEDPDLNKLLQAQDMDYRFPRETRLCTDNTSRENCFLHPLGFADANLSVAKLDDLVERTAGLEIYHERLSSDRVSLAIIYEKIGTGTDTGIPVAYRNFHRAYLPANASDISVTVNNLPVPAEEGEATGSALPYAVIDREDDRTVVGVGFTDNLDEAATVTVSYVLDAPVSQNRERVVDLSYSLPYGLRDIPVEIKIAAGDALGIRPVVPGPAQWFAKDGSLRYNTVINKFMKLTYVVSLKEP